MSVRDDIERARAGDRQALDSLLERCGRRLTALAQSRLGQALRPQMHTSDLLQSTYLDVVKSIENFDGENEDDFVRWTGRILENNLRDKTRYFDAGKRKGTEAVTTDPASPGHGPSSELSIGEDLSLVGRALENLSEDHRSVIVLRLLRGMHYEEVARELGRSEEATRALLSRARATLLLEIDRLRS